MKGPTSYPRQIKTPLEFALFIANQFEDDFERVSRLQDVLASLVRARKRRQVWPVSRQMLAIARRLKQKEARVEVLLDVANLLVLAGDARHARAVLKEARTIVDQFKDDSRDTAKFLRSLANVLILVGDMRMACDLLETSLTMADEMEDPRDKVARFVYIAGDFARAGSVERSRAVFAQADACLRPLDDRGFEASMAQDMGRVLREMGDSVGASKLLVHLYSRAAEIPKVTEKASAFITVAHALVQAGEKRWAHMVLQRAIGNIALFENESDQADELQYAAYLATRADEAHALLRRILVFANGFKDPDNKASLLIDIADSLASVKSKERARSILQRAFNVSSMIESGFVRARILRRIAMSLEEMGSHAEAHSMWLYAFGIAVSVPAADKRAEWMEEIPGYFVGAGRFTEAIAVACALPGVVSYHRGGSSVSYPVNRSKALDALLKIAEDLAMPYWKRNGERRMKKAFNSEEKRMAAVIAHVVRGAARHDARTGFGSGGA